MSNKSIAKEKTDYSLLWIFIISIVIVCSLWLFTYLSLKDLEDTKRGSFGDMFGGANTLFSGLAFVGIIITVLLQRKELSLQRMELATTREELKRTANAQENQERALNRQAENLKISAKLTALNTLVNYYSEQELRLRNMTSFGNEKAIIAKKETYLNRIEQILNAKESDMNI